MREKVSQMSQKVCAIVGFGAGVSMGVSKAFGKEGYTLALLARNPTKLIENAQALEQEGNVVQTFVADAGDETSLIQAFAQIRTQLGDPEVLIYNAALLKQDSVMNLVIDDLIQDFRVNVAGAVTAMQQVIPAMQQQKRGTILLTGGGLSLYPSPQLLSLGIGKAAIRHLTMSLAEELKTDGIHIATVTICGTVAPGTKFDPNAIAQSYLALHKQPLNAFETEMIYQ
jgi:short-subunit dehydrogenase